MSRMYAKPCWTVLERQAAFWYLNLVLCPQAINQPAKIIESSYAQVDLDQVLGIKAFNLDRVLEIEPDFLVCVNSCNNTCWLV